MCEMVRRASSSACAAMDVALPALLHGLGCGEPPAGSSAAAGRGGGLMLIDINCAPWSMQ